MDDDLVFTQALSDTLQDISSKDGDKGHTVTLKVLSKGISGHPTEFNIHNGTNTIGRHSTCDISIPWSPTVSKKHAVIEAENGTYFLSDCGSSNKSRFGRVLLKPNVQYALRHGDEITFGDVKCVFHVSDDTEFSDVASKLHQRVLATDTPDTTRHNSKLLDKSDLVIPDSQPTEVKSEIPEDTKCASSNSNHLNKEDTNRENGDCHMDSDTDIEDDDPRNIIEHYASEDDIYQCSTLPLEVAQHNQTTESSQYDEEFNDNADDEMSLIADLATAETQRSVADHSKHGATLMDIAESNDIAGTTTSRQDDVPGCSRILHSPAADPDETYEADSFGDSHTQTFTMPRKSTMFEDTLGLIETQAFTDPPVVEDSESDVEDSMLCDIETQAFHVGLETKSKTQPSSVAHGDNEAGSDPILALENREDTPSNTLHSSTDCDVDKPAGDDADTLPLLAESELTEVTDDLISSGNSLSGQTEHCFEGMHALDDETPPLQRTGDVVVPLEKYSSRDITSSVGAGNNPSQTSSVDSDAYASALESVQSSGTSDYGTAQVGASKPENEANELHESSDLCVDTREEDEDDETQVYDISDLVNVSVATDRTTVVEESVGESDVETVNSAETVAAKGFKPDDNISGSEVVADKLETIPDSSSEGFDTNCGSICTPENVQNHVASVEPSADPSGTVGNSAPNADLKAEESGDTNAVQTKLAIEEHAIAIDNVSSSDDTKNDIETVTVGGTSASDNIEPQNSLELRVASPAIPDNDLSHSNRASTNDLENNHEEIETSQGSEISEEAHSNVTAKCEEMGNSVATDVEKSTLPASNENEATLYSSSASHSVKEFANPSAISTNHNQETREDVVIASPLLTGKSPDHTKKAAKVDTKGPFTTDENRNIVADCPDKKLPPETQIHDYSTDPDVETQSYCKPGKMQAAATSDRQGAPQMPIDACKASITTQAISDNIDQITSTQCYLSVHTPQNQSDIASSSLQDISQNKPISPGADMMATQSFLGADVSKSKKLSPVLSTKKNLTNESPGTPSRPVLARTRRSARKDYAKMANGETLEALEKSLSKDSCEEKVSVEKSKGRKSRNMKVEAVTPVPQNPDSKDGTATKIRNTRSRVSKRKIGGNDSTVSIDETGASSQDIDNKPSRAVRKSARTLSTATDENTKTSVSTANSGIGAKSRVSRTAETAKTASKSTTLVKKTNSKSRKKPEEKEPNADVYDFESSESAESSVRIKSVTSKETVNNRDVVTDCLPSTSKAVGRTSKRNVGKRIAADPSQTCLKPKNEHDTTKVKDEAEATPARLKSKNKNDATKVKDEAEAAPAANQSRKRRNNSACSAIDKRKKSDEADLVTETQPRKAKVKPNVMFTGITNNTAESIVTNLGGRMASEIEDCTHLVTDKMRRTIKFLCAVSRGVHIVTPQWLIKSGENKRFLSEDPFLLEDDRLTPNDEPLQTKYNFNLRNTLESVGKSENKLFDGLRFYVTKSVIPDRQQMGQILRSAGATVLGRMPKVTGGSDLSDLVLVATPEDRSGLSGAIERKCRIVSNEFVLTGVLRNVVDFDSFSLFASENDPPASQEDSKSARVGRPRRRK